MPPPRVYKTPRKRKSGTVASPSKPQQPASARIQSGRGAASGGSRTSPSGGGQGDSRAQNATFEPTANQSRSATRGLSYGANPALTPKTEVLHKNHGFVSLKYPIGTVGLQISQIIPKEWTLRPKAGLQRGPRIQLVSGGQPLLGSQQLQQVTGLQTEPASRQKTSGCPTFVTLNYHTPTGSLQPPAGPQQQPTLKPPSRPRLIGGVSILNSREASPQVQPESGPSTPFLIAGILILNSREPSPLKESQTLVTPAEEVEETLSISDDEVGWSDSIDVPAPLDFAALLGSDSGIDVDTPKVVSGKLPSVTANMAPVTGVTAVQDSLKDVVQDLFDIQSQTHGYQHETHGPMVEKMITLTASLARVKNQTNETHPDYQILPSVPPELVDYVDGGRNPDIYTREVVEALQRGSAVVNGKMEAFRGFSVVFAKKLREEFGAGSGEDTGRIDVDKEVERIMRNAGLENEGGGDVKMEERRSGEGIENVNGADRTM